MRAAVLETFGRPLTVEQVPDPAPGPGRVVVRVRAAGVCRTDLKIVDGGIPTVRTPLVPGHESAGEVVALGPGVTGFEEGDRVAVTIDVSCGSCPYCRIGQTSYCASLRRVGIEEPGGLAEYLAVPAGNLVPLPDAVSFDVGATLADAVGSSYHAVVSRARVRAAETVAVYGLGGLGLVAVQVGALAGADVIAIARDPDRRALAERLGAAASLDPREGDLAARIRELTGGLGVHAFLDFVGIEGSVQRALLSCRKGGRIVVVGYLAQELNATMMPLVYNEVSILGSRGSTRADLVEALDLVERRQIMPVVGLELGLERVNEALDALRAATVVGRAILHP
jgi:2-desacetyl-2-hydroxyethyl bacteriochlorophyllide A dehydrogenase